MSRRAISIALNMLLGSDKTFGYKKSVAVNVTDTSAVHYCILKGLKGPQSYKECKV